MKKNLIFTLCFLLTFSMTACAKEDTLSIPPDNSEAALNTTSSEVTKDVNTSEEMDSENEMKQDNIEFGLAINDTYYPIPITLKQLVNEGWSISDKTPYFLNPMVGESYYEMRTNWSLSKNGEGILPGGSIIRLLERDGVLLEVTITNQATTEEAEPYQKIEDGVIDSITVFYDEAHTSIKLNDRELNSLTPDILITDYPASDGWVHCPNNYRDYPEFGVSTVHDISNNLDQCNRSITVYFDSENSAFKITVLNQTPLEN